MEHEAWSSFRLVGGTALSLQLGHRMSIDLDLFTDSPYGSVDFDQMDRSMEELFKATDFNRTNPPGLGKTYYFQWNGCALKVDAFYTDPFLEPAKLFGFLRLAGLRDLAAMKMDVLQRGGRKKDFGIFTHCTINLALTSFSTHTVRVTRSSTTPNYYGPS
jgi:hypothetical protein